MLRALGLLFGLFQLLPAHDVGRSKHEGKAQLYGRKEARRCHAKGSKLLAGSVCPSVLLAKSKACALRLKRRLNAENG